MTITSQLLEAYVKCRTKCWLRYVGENPTGNAYSEWVQATNEAYRAEGVKRLVAEAPDGGRVATSPTDNLKTATWRMAADIPTRAPNLETRISIVERVFLCVRGGIDADLRQQRQRRVRAGIDHDVAQRGGRWQCKSADRHAVHGSQQHDALDDVARVASAAARFSTRFPQIPLSVISRDASARDATSSIFNDLQAAGSISNLVGRWGIGKRIGTVCKNSRWLPPQCADFRRLHRAD